MLKLFYITNKPDIAVIAQDAGVDRIFVDMEYIGKDERQGGLDTVQNHHTVEDVKNIRRVLTTAELLVRVNPIHNNSAKEIEAVICEGADTIMLPMWKTPQEVERFISFVGGRAKTMLLLETDEARLCLDEVLKIKGIDEIHIGLNDLKLSQNKNFLFELLVDGTVDEIVDKIKKTDIPYGFGGVGRINSDAPLPAENILAEHYRLGSSMVILSRAFCNTYGDISQKAVRERFETGVKEIRAYEAFLENYDSEFFKSKHRETTDIIERIVREI